MVKCAECGLIAMGRPDKLDEVEKRLRLADNDGVSMIRDLAAAPLIFPICAAGINLQAELGNDSAKSKHDVIHRQRECGKFRTWLPGFPPEKHKAIMDQELLLEYQHAVEREAREWREKMRREDLDWKGRQEDIARHQFHWQLVVLGVLVAASQIIAAVLTAMIPIWCQRDQPVRVVIPDKIQVTIPEKAPGKP